MFDGEGDVGCGGLVAYDKGVDGNVPAMVLMRSSSCVPRRRCRVL